MRPTGASTQKQAPMWTRALSAPVRSSRGKGAALFAKRSPSRSIRELAKLAGDEICDLLADVDGVVPDPLEAARDRDHPQAPLEALRIGPEREHLPHDAAVRAIDELVELDERRRTLEVTVRERVERDADHPLRPRAHVRERISRAGRSRARGRACERDHRSGASD